MNFIYRHKKRITGITINFPRTIIRVTSLRIHLLEPHSPAILLETWSHDRPHVLSHEDRPQRKPISWLRNNANRDNGIVAQEVIAHITCEKISRYRNLGIWLIPIVRSVEPFGLFVGLGWGSM